MRAISLVKKLEFEFGGNVARNALTLGDVDNDGHNELIIGNDQGEVAVFKGSEKVQTITNLSFIACVAIGDIKNEGKNSLVIISSEGWCYIYEVPCDSLKTSRDEDLTVSDSDVEEVKDEVDGQGQSSSNLGTTTTESSCESTVCEQKTGLKKDLKNPLVCVHRQRIPADVKAVILGDVDGDGQIEMVLGLTDRVVRSYRFAAMSADPTEVEDPPQSGKLVALNKWECANQIGSITLHHSLDGEPSILVAQPGGTFMRIKCQKDSTDKSHGSNAEALPVSVDYQFLGISRMRNQNISTEIVGDLRFPSIGDGGPRDSCKSRPYAVATLDGTIMLVQDEVILWAIAVDHQIFALNKLDVTGNGSDDIVVCSWDGQTYILDQDKNSVRFHLEEPVRAFHSGWYSPDTSQAPVTALVYVTFKNSVVVYYDIPLRDLVCKRFEPDIDKLSEVFVDNCTSKEEAVAYVGKLEKKAKRDLIEYLLYDAK